PPSEPALAPSEPAVAPSEPAPPVSATPPSAPASSPPPKRASDAPLPAFVDAELVRAAGVAAGLRLPIGVYANVAAGLATGRHLILTGPPGAGKTTLALAVARAAAQAGRARG